MLNTRKSSKVIGRYKEDLKSKRIIFKIPNQNISVGNLKKLKYHLQSGIYKMIKV